MAHPRPFRSAEAAWLWCWPLLQARLDGRAPRADLAEGGNRPCTPDDIVRQLEVLFSAGRITTEQVVILRRYGEKGRGPSPAMAGEEQDWRKWRSALHALEEQLYVRGIVAPRQAAAMPRVGAFG
jgi:hypothetical protein